MDAVYLVARCLFVRFRAFVLSYHVFIGFPIFFNGMAISLTCARVMFVCFDPVLFVRLLFVRVWLFVRVLALLESLVALAVT
jgi:hypothetical protein